jgi:succinoglycan biosynthesis protein ExoA
MLICLGYGAVLGLRAGQACAAASGVPAMIMHAAWSLGFLRELIAPTRAAPALLRAKQA